MKSCLALLPLGLLGSLLACKNPEPAQTAKSLKRQVFMTELRPDSTTIARYEQVHRAENLWPEINRAAQAAGFTNITIHRFGNRLVMIQEFPADADKQRLDSLYVASSPKLQEWGRLMATFQQAPSGAKPGETWVELKEIYAYPNP